MDINNSPVIVRESTMKVLFVITGLGMGGAENLVVNLADYFKQHGHQVIIVYAFGNAIVKPESNGIPLISLGVKSYKDFFSGYVKLRRIIKEFRPDVVHSHMVHANLLSRLVRMTINIPRLICTAHNTNEGGRGRMWAYKLTDSLNDISTNVSQEAVDSFVSLGAVSSQRMISIPNGIDINKFHYNEKNNFFFSKDKEEKIIISVGRFNEQKDYPNLIRAISILVKKKKDIRVKIVGDGDLKMEIIDLARSLNVDNYIDFLGIRRDIAQLMSASDIFVLSSSYEGFGLVVAEAMACERPVVATDCGGVKEVVGDCGILVEPRNSEQLAEAINHMLNLSANDRLKMGKKARQRIIDNFSLDTTAKKYMDLYKSGK